MELNIPETLSDTLHEIGEIGGKHAYLVGGSVRDILLKRPSFDIDVVVEGDAVQVAERDTKTLEWNTAGASTIWNCNSYTGESG